MHCSEIDEEYSREYFQGKSGERTVPQLFKDGVFLGQSDFVGTLSDKQLEDLLGVEWFWKDLENKTDTIEIND